MTEAPTTASRNLPSLSLALLPVLLTLGLLAVQLFYYNDSTPHIPLAIGLAITSVLVMLRGQEWPDIREVPCDPCRAAVDCGVDRDGHDRRRVDCLRHSTQADLLRAHAGEPLHLSGSGHGAPAHRAAASAFLGCGGGRTHRHLY